MDRQFSERLWQQFNCQIPYTWEVTPAAQSNLRQIIPNLAVDFGKFPDCVNRSLRANLSEHLTAKEDTSKCLAIWIVRNWGGIRRGDETIPKWMIELDGFGR
jgi:hypothetical protein